MDIGDSYELYKTEIQVNRFPNDRRKIVPNQLGPATLNIFLTQNIVGRQTTYYGRDCS